MTEETQKKVKAHCNKCLHETNHLIVGERMQEGSQDISGQFDEFQHEINWSTTNRMIECCGCETVSLHQSFWFSEIDDIEETFYPPQISRQLPKWYDDLPEEWQELLAEVYTALHADSRRLVLMGARALVDLYMTEKLGDIGGFAVKIKKLESNGLISKVNKAVLEAVLEAGHAAAHRGHKAKPNEINQVVDIVENLLQSHVLERAAENLKSKTPKRDKKS